MKKSLPALLAAALIVVPAANIASAEGAGANDVPADAAPTETRTWPVTAHIERDADTGELSVDVRPRGCLSVSLPIESENIRVDLMPATDMFWQMEPNHIRITGGYEVPAGRRHVDRVDVVLQGDRDAVQRTAHATFRALAIEPVGFLEQLFLLGLRGVTDGRVLGVVVGGIGLE